MRLHLLFATCFCTAVKAAKMPHHLPSSTSWPSKINLVDQASVAIVAATKKMIRIKFSQANLKKLNKIKKVEALSASYACNPQKFLNVCTRTVRKMALNYSPRPSRKNTTRLSNSMSCNRSRLPLPAIIKMRTIMRVIN